MRIRNPLHKVECRQSADHVVVEADGVVLADSRRPVVLEESGLPDRYYLPLDDVRAVRAAFGVSVNDVVLGIVAGSLRRHLLSIDALPASPLVAGVPVAADPASERLSGNRVSNLFTSLRTDLDDPVARLAAIHEVTGAAKEVQDLLGVDMLANWIEYAPPRP